MNANSLDWPVGYRPHNTYHQLARTPQAHAVWFALCQGPGLQLLIRATETGRPALSLVEPLLMSLIDPSWWSDSAKQMVEQMVRQIMEGHGFQLAETAQPFDGYLFSSAARYEGSVGLVP